MIKVAIAGGTGYTAGELLRILLNHPDAEVIGVLSSSQAGAPVASVHRDLLGDTDLRFSASLSDFEKPDILFLTLGHGLSREYLDRLDPDPACRIIDLGNDFRTDTAYRGGEFVYGLPEAGREIVAAAAQIANPGCFATAILLPLLPLATRGGLTHDIHIHAITGSTGAGKNLSETGHFSYRAGNVSVYKPFAHQHLAEIRKTLAHAAIGGVPDINFVPMRGDFTRGIFASIYTKKNAGVTLDGLIRDYVDFYAPSPFVHISDEPVSLKEVVNTNKALIHIEEHNGHIHFTSVIDNLLKGAAGQAVQNMNLMCGLPETAGLKLKPSAF